MGMRSLLGKGGKRGSGIAMSMILVDQTLGKVCCRLLRNRNHVVNL